MGSSESSKDDDFSVLVLSSDLGIDARPFLTAQETVGVQITREEDEPEENWHDCSQDILSDEDFSDLDLLQFIRLQGSDKSRNRIVRVVGKYFPVVDVYQLLADDEPQRMIATYQELTAKRRVIRKDGVDCQNECEMLSILIEKAPGSSGLMSSYEKWWNCMNDGIGDGSEIKRRLIHMVLEMHRQKE